MAKDRMNMSDLDFDSSMNDFNFEGEKINAGRPVSPAAAIGGAFFKSMAGKTASMIGRSISREMPSITSNFNEAKNVISDISQLKQDFSKRINPSIISIRHTSARLLGRVGKFLPPGLQKTIETLSKKIDAEAPKDSRTTTLEAQEAVIQNELGELFKNQARLSNAIHQEGRLNTAIDRELGSIRHSALMQPMVAMASSLHTLTNFHLTTHLAWMKKSLELQYRQLYATQDQLGITTNLANMIDVRLHDITHNTSIPDSEKANIKMQLKQSLRTTRNDLVFGWTRNMVGRIKDNIFNKLADAIEDIAGMGELGTDMLELNDEMNSIDMGDAMGDAFGEEPAEDPKVTKMKKHASTLGGAAGWIAHNRYGKKLITKLHPFLKDINTWGSNLRGRSGVKLDRLRKEWEYESGIKGFLANFVLPEMAPNTKIDSNTIDGDESGIAAANFDTASRRSLVEVIPGWLGKIHLVNQEIRDALTGQTKAREYVYDPSSRDFVTTKELSDKYTELIFGDKAYRASRLDMAVGQLQGKHIASGGADDNNLKQLSDTVRLIFSNLAVGFETFEPTYFYKWLNSGDEFVWNNLVDNYIKKAQGDIPSEEFRAAVVWLVKVIFADGNVPDQHLINQIELHYFPQITNESFMEVMEEVSKGWGHQRFIKPYIKVDSYGKVSLNKQAVARGMVETTDETKTNYQTYGRHGYDSSFAEREEELNRQRQTWGDKAIDIASGKTTVASTDTFYGRMMATPPGRLFVGAAYGVGYVAGAGATKVIGQKRIDWIQRHVKSIQDKLHLLSLNDNGTEAKNLFEALKNMVRHGIWNKDTELMVARMDNKLENLGWEIDSSTGEVKETPTTLQSEEDAGEVDDILNGRNSLSGDSGSKIKFAKIKNKLKSKIHKDFLDQIEKLKLMVLKLPKHKQVVAARRVSGLIIRINDTHGAPPGGIAKNIEELVHELDYEIKMANNKGEAVGSGSTLYNRAVNRAVNMASSVGATVKKAGTNMLQKLADIRARISKGDLAPLHPQLDMYLTEIISILKNNKKSNDEATTTSEPKTAAEEAEAVANNIEDNNQLDSIIEILDHTARMHVNNHNDLMDLLGAIGESVDRVRFIGFGDAKEIVSAAYQSIRERLKSGKDWVKQKTGKIFGGGWTKFKGATKWLKEKTFKIGGMLIGKGRFGGSKLKGFLGGFGKGLFNLDKTDLFDIHLAGRIDPEHPLLSARQIRDGVFYGDGTRVEDPRDIDRPVFDAEKNILITEDHLTTGLVNVKGEPISSVGHKGLGLSLGRLTRKLLRGTGKGGKSLLGGIGKLLMGTESTITKEIEEQYFDVYLKGKESTGSPLLSKKQQEDGVWLMGSKKKKGGRLERTKDITKPVYGIVDGKRAELIISKGDIDHGLVDVNGNSIYDHKLIITETSGREGILGPLFKGLGKTASGGLEILRKTLLQALGLTGKAGELWLEIGKMATKGIGKVASGAWDWLRGKSNEAEDSPTVLELRRLYELVDTRTKGLNDFIKRSTPKKKSVSDSAHEDVNKDGIRDGSFMDQQFKKEGDETTSDNDGAGGNADESGDPTIPNTVAEAVKSSLAGNKPGKFRKALSWITNTSLGRDAILAALWKGKKFIAPIGGAISGAARSTGKSILGVNKKLGKGVLGKLNRLVDPIAAVVGAYRGFKDVGKLEEAGALDSWAADRNTVKDAYGQHGRIIVDKWNESSLLGKFTTMLPSMIHGSARESVAQLRTAAKINKETKKLSMENIKQNFYTIPAMQAEYMKRLHKHLNDIDAPLEIHENLDAFEKDKKMNRSILQKYVNTIVKNHWRRRLFQLRASSDDLGKFNSLFAMDEYKQFVTDYEKSIDASKNPRNKIDDILDQIESTKTSTQDTATADVAEKDWKDSTTLGVTTVDINTNKTEQVSDGRSDGVRASDGDAITTEAWRNASFNNLPSDEQDKLIIKLRSIASEKGLSAAREALVALSAVTPSKPTPITQPPSEAHSLDIDSWAKPPKYEDSNTPDADIANTTSEIAQPTKISPVESNVTNEILNRLLAEMIKVRELVGNISTQANNLTPINEGIIGLMDITVQSANKTAQLLSISPSQPKSPVLAIGRGKY